MDIPCKDCISLSICRQRIIKNAGNRIHEYSIIHLIVCSAFVEYDDLMFYTYAPNEYDKLKKIRCDLIKYILECEE